MDDYEKILQLVQMRHVFFQVKSCTKYYYITKSYILCIESKLDTWHISIYVSEKLNSRCLYVITVHAEKWRRQKNFSFATLRRVCPEVNLVNISSPLHM
jgi:hypothetical protein